MEVDSIYTPEYKSNTYIVTDVDSNRAIIIDPTLFSITEINNYIFRNELTIDYVIPTHGHFDHIEGIDRLKDSHQFDVIANSECSIAFQNPKKNYSFFLKSKNISLNPPNIIIDEVVHQFLWNNTKIQIIKTPGHSPCSACIAINNEMLFTGDSLLKDFKPVTKLPDSDKSQYINSICQIFNGFPSDIIIYPGHGESFLLSSYKC